MTSRASGARFRQRKLSTKHALQVVREDEIADTFGDENDPARHIPRVETGVERAEETEHHLQAVISASAAASLGGKVAQIYIPTPETKSSSIKYDQLYPKRFSQPATYIRFSSTVEDCVGAPYCMTEEDDKFLQTLNQSKGQANGSAKDGDGKCTEDLFEEVMSFFEETCQTRQPFAAIDNPPVLSLEEMERSYDDTISIEARKWANALYSHWQLLRVENGNRGLIPALKIETGQETDDADAYVCFRRREVRQARKTRGRDAQVTDKLKKLRRELEDARQLIHCIHQREQINSERVEYERKVFDQRSELKRVKIEQGIKVDNGDDQDLLVNQRPVPKPKSKGDGQQRPTTLRLSTSQRGSDGRPPDNDLISLEDVQAEAAELIERSVATKIAKHREWNKGFLDQTWNPITPPLETSSMSGYLPRVEEVQLPTPPASVRSDSLIDENKIVEMKDVDLPTPVSDQDTTTKTMFRFASPPPDSLQQRRVAYRRRYGRGGRMHIEERWPSKAPIQKSHGVVYDSDEEDAEEGAVYPMDYYDSLSLNYRASLLASRGRAEPGAEQPIRRGSSNDVAMANGQSTAGHGT